MKNSDRQNRLMKPFIENSRTIITLPPIGGKILKGTVILTGSVTLSNGTTNGTVVGEGGPANLIQDINVYANPASGSRYPGGRIVDGCSPRSLLRFATYMRQGRYMGDLSGSTLGGGANGTYQFYLPIPIYFAAPEKRRQVETALNADPSAYELIQVEVNTGDITDCFSGNDATVDYSSLQIQWMDDRENFAGDTYVRYQEEHTLMIPASNTRMLDEAMPRDGAFEDWSILSEVSTAQTLGDTLLNKVELDGTALNYKKYADDIRAQMYDDGWLNPAQAGTGMHYIDFTDGLVTGTIDAATLQTRLDVNNVSGADQDQLRIFTRRLFAPANPQWAWGQRGKNS